MGNKLENCKYYNQNIEVISRYIDCLYNLPDCCCGGMLHIVTDDDNVEDDNLDWCFDYINKQENTNEVDKEIDELILKNMKKLTLEQRRLLTIGRNWNLPFCCQSKAWGISDCSECIIENEDIE